MKTDNVKQPVFFHEEFLKKELRKQLEIIKD